MPDTKSIFNSVAKNYDLLNTLFSFGRDKQWRKRLAREIDGSELVLDIATGTAEVAIELINNNNKGSVIGIDPSHVMLELGQRKLKSIGGIDKIDLVQGIAETLPFKDNIFDAITIAFGIRNTVDPIKALQEMKRVLKTQGKLGILEFAVPQNKIFGPPYMFYLENVMPFVGSIFGTREEYKYLGDSISEFPNREYFISLLQDAGFVVEKSIELMIGTVIIYIGIKKK